MCCCSVHIKSSKCPFHQFDLRLKEGSSAVGHAGVQVTSSSPSFEEVALRLMETGEPEAVAAFLQTRLDTLGREDKAQVGSAEARFVRAIIL